MRFELTEHYCSSVFKTDAINQTLPAFHGCRERSQTALDMQMPHTILLYNIAIYSKTPMVSQTLYGSISVPNGGWYRI